MRRVRVSNPVFIILNLILPLFGLAFEVLPIEVEAGDWDVPALFRDVLLNYFDVVLIIIAYVRHTFLISITFFLLQVEIGKDVSYNVVRGAVTGVVLLQVPNGGIVISIL